MGVIYENLFYNGCQGFSMDGYPMDVIDIVGWLPKQCLELKSDYFEAGTDRERDDGTFTHCRTNMFEIPNSDLLDISYLKQ